VLHIDNLDLEKQLRKLKRITKENHDTLQARENRKLNIKVKKYVKKVNEDVRDNEF
jgi:hypothetical protein